MSQQPCEWCGAESVASVAVGHRHASACAECEKRLAQQPTRPEPMKADQPPIFGSNVGTDRQPARGWWE